MKTGETFLNCCEVQGLNGCIRRHSLNIVDPIPCLLWLFASLSLLVNTYSYKLPGPAVTDLFLSAWSFGRLTGIDIILLKLRHRFLRYG
jgi:hypothetical protein